MLSFLGVGCSNYNKLEQACPPDVITNLALYVISDCVYKKVKSRQKVTRLLNILNC